MEQDLIMFIGNKRLPEIPIEQRTQNYHAERGDNIPLVPALFDERLVVTCERDELNLFSGWFFSKEGY